jgi:hypothetical protein
MIGLDSSGLSDPFVRVNLHNESSTSAVKTQTNNPAWNETIYIKELFLYGSLSSIVASPPEIILEILDQDKNVCCSFLHGFSCLGWLSFFLSICLKLMNSWDDVYAFQW